MWKHFTIVLSWGRLMVTDSCKLVLEDSQRLHKSPFSKSSQPFQSATLSWQRRHTIHFCDKALIRSFGKLYRHSRPGTKSTARPNGFISPTSPCISRYILAWDYFTTRAKNTSSFSLSLSPLPHYSGNISLHKDLPSLQKPRPPSGHNRTHSTT